MQKLKNGFSVLLFGCSGLLGRYIYFSLKKENISFFSYSKKKPIYVNRKKWKSFNLKSVFKNKTINDLAKAKIVIINAALKPNKKKNYNYSLYKDCNEKFIVRIVELCKKYNFKIIYISGVLTEKINLLKKNKKVSEQKIYYLKSKLKSEKYIQKKIKKKNYLIIKTTSIYGYGLKKENILKKIIYKKKNQDLLLNNEIYNFIHAFDIARFIVYSINKKLFGTKYLIGDYISLKQIYNITINKKHSENNNNNNNSIFYEKRKFKFKNIINIKKGINLLKKNKFI
jgi:dTDP-4-dehydrorhamnose reductase